jgi:very-short-patch-repair endonuclease
VSGDPLFLALLRQASVPAPVPEYRFAPPRKWRADWAWPDHRVALEVEGGVWTGGRHTRGAGFLKDCEKYNELAALGWRLLRTTPSGLHDLATIALIKRTITPLP